MYPVSMSPSRPVFPNPALGSTDDERREPMGLNERDRCRSCHGAVSRTDASGLCWSCMPC